MAASEPPTWERPCSVFLTLRLITAAAAEMRIFLWGDEPDIALS